MFALDAAEGKLNQLSSINKVAFDRAEPALAWSATGWLAVARWGGEVQLQHPETHACIVIPALQPDGRIGRMMSTSWADASTLVVSRGDQVLKYSQLPLDLTP